MSELIDDAENLEVGEFYLVSAPQQGWERVPWILDGAIVEYLGERKVKIISIVEHEGNPYQGLSPYKSRITRKFRIGGTVEISSRGFLKYRKL